MKEIKPRPTVRIYAGIAAIWAWFAVLMQFYLIVLNRTDSIGETVVRFFAYFTILSNILAAITLTVVTVNLNSAVCRFCRRSEVLTAVTVYISMVGIVYNFLLRQIWAPEGLQQIVDEMLHSVNPVLYLFFWALFVPKQALEWKNSLRWLIFPLVYMIFTLIRGSITNYYPYPFINVVSIGYGKALLNAGWLLLFFEAVSLLLITFAKLTLRRKKFSTSALYSK